MKEKKKKRNNILDFFKSIAFILMIIHHIYYFRISSKIPYIIPSFAEYSGIISRNLFILINGYVSYKYFSNSKDKDIFIHSLIVSMSSYFLLPKNNLIYFGVLHYLFLSSFILKYKKDWLVFLLGIISFFNRNKTSFFYLQNSSPIDFFDPIKWFYKSSIGYFIGYFINFPNIEIKYSDIISKNCLFLYTSHIIIFMFLQKRFF